MEIMKEVSIFEIICHTIHFDKGISDLHWHDRYELCQVVQNDCSFIIDGVTFKANVGDIIAINDKVIHQFVIKENDTLIRVCQFPLKSLINSKSILNPLKIHITAEEINKIPNLYEKLNMFFYMMEEEEGAGLTSNNPYLQSLATGIYFLLERHFSSLDSAKSDERERNEFFRIVEYINAHFKEEINVEHIAKKLFLSRGRLTSIFKKYAGESVSDYINKIRIKNANILLFGGTSVSEAALESGFANIRTFNNIYKEVMKITPSEYIKMKK